MFFWDEDSKRLQDVNDAVLSIRNNINKILSEPDAELVQALPRDLINDISRMVSYQEVWENNMCRIQDRICVLEETIRDLTFFLKEHNQDVKKLKKKKTKKEKPL